MKPWEKYSEQAGEAGPWSKYAAGPAPEPAQPESSAPAEFSWMQMLRNVPGSAGNAANNMLQPIMHPIDTAKALGNVALGTAQKLIPGQQDSEAYADAVGKMIVDRYGSWDAFKKTTQDDPVGVMMDASAILSGGGALARGLTQAGSIPNRVGQILQKSGAALDPVNQVKAIVGAITPRSLPASLYESAAKFPPQSVLRDTRTKIVETALQNKIKPTGRGIDKLTAMIEQLDTRIDDLVKQADATGKVIPRGAIYSELRALKSDLKGGAAEPANVAAMSKVIGDLEGELRKGPRFWTPSRLQEFKVKTYRDINWKKDPDATTATYQALARGARKGMEKVSPEIAEVNKTYGPLAELRDRLPQVANRIDNLNMLPLTLPLYGALGGTVGDVAGTMLGAAASLLNYPKISSGLALYLRGLQDNPLSVGGTAVRQGLLQSGRLNDLGILE